MSMKKFVKFTAAAVAVFACVGQAQAADYGMASGYGSAWYLRGDLGWSWLNWSGGPDDDQLTGGLGVGMNLDAGVRTDLRYDLSDKYSSSGDFAIQAITGNVYYDFPTGEMASPYIGLGVGYGWAGSGKSGDDKGFAGQLHGGLNLRMTDMLTGDVSYRYRDIILDGDDLVDHSLMAGVRYSF